MFKNYLKTSFRNLGRNKVYAAINIAGLSLGLACAMLIILYVKDEIGFDRFHKKGDRIYRVVSEETDKSGKRKGMNASTGYLQGPKFSANVPGIQAFVRVQSGSEDIRKGAEVTSHEVLYTDSSFFSVFTFPLIAGDARDCLKDQNSIVLSADEARKQFGTEQAVGKTLQLKKNDSFVPYTVTAVAANTPQNSSLRFQILLPLVVSAEENKNPENWFNTFLNTFVLLSPHVSDRKVETGMQRYFQEDSKEAVKMITAKFGDVFGAQKYRLQPYSDMHLSTDLPAQNGLSNSSNPVYSYILTGIAVFILLIACINFINLTVARSVRRAREIGIRKVVGGERRQLIVQFLGESFFLCLIAFLFAVLLVQLTLPVFNRMADKHLALSYLLDVKLISGYLVLLLITGLLAGFYPALVLSGYNPVQTLYSRFILGGKNYLQRTLVIIQFTLASFLIIATLTIYQQFSYLISEKLGYDDHNLVSVNKSQMSRDEASLFRSELLKSGDIVDVAAKNGGSWFTVARVNADSTINFAYETVDERFLPMLKIGLQKGRNFSQAYPSDSSHSVLVNEAFVKKAGWKDPLGKQVHFWYDHDKKYSVVGVVKDYHFQPLKEKIGPQLFTMKKDNPYGMVYIRIRPGSEKQSLPFVEHTFKKLFPSYPYTYTFKNDENRKSYESEARWKQIMLFSAVLTVFISCIGLFGLSVLSAEKRTKEIGIRKVLGASVKNVVAILSRDFVTLVIISLLIAIPLAWMAAGKWLENYPYRMHLHWTLFAAAGVLVIAVALITVSFQAIKAAIANPVKSLRSE